MDRVTGMVQVVTPITGNMLLFSPMAWLEQWNKSAVGSSFISMKITPRMNVIWPHKISGNMTQVAVMLSKRLKPSKEFQGCLEKVDQRSYHLEKLVENAYIGN